MEIVFGRYPSQISYGTLTVITSFQKNVISLHF